MSKQTARVSAIGLFLSTVVFGCSRTDRDVSGIQQPAQRSAVSPEIRDYAAGRVSATPGEKVSTANDEPSSVKTAAAANDAEILDTDEPGGKRRDANANVVRDQPDAVENRDEDQDDPNAEPVVQSVDEPDAGKPSLNDGRAAGAAPDPALAAQSTDATAAAGVSDDGRSKDAKANVEKLKDIGGATQAKRPLPEKLQVLDVNQDGQIALAEWPREKLAEFNKLDKNKDGFLNAQEWAAGLAKTVEDDASQQSADSPQNSKNETAEDRPAAQQE